MRRIEICRTIDADRNIEKKNIYLPTYPTIFNLCYPNSTIFFFRPHYLVIVHFWVFKIYDVQHNSGKSYQFMSGLAKTRFFFFWLFPVGFIGFWALMGFLGFYKKVGNDLINSFIQACYYTSNACSMSSHKFS